MRSPICLSTANSNPDVCFQTVSEPTANPCMGTPGLLRRTACQMGLVRELLWMDAVHPSYSQHMAEQVLQKPALARSISFAVLCRKGGANPQQSSAACHSSVVPQQHSKRHIPSSICLTSSRSSISQRLAGPGSNRACDAYPCRHLIMAVLDCLMNPTASRLRIGIFITHEFKLPCVHAGHSNSHHSVSEGSIHSPSHQHLRSGATAKDLDLGCLPLLLDGLLRKELPLGMDAAGHCLRQQLVVADKLVRHAKLGAGMSGEDTTHAFVTNARGMQIGG